MDRLNHFGPISAWRERLFTLDVPVTLTSNERDILFKYIANLWRYKHNTHRGRVFVCRASRKPKSVDKNRPDYHVPVEKQRNRKTREQVPCPASMVEVELPGGYWYYERRGKEHSHGLEIADNTAPSVPLRLLERSKKKKMSMRATDAEREDRNWDRREWKSEDGRKRVKLTHEEIDVMELYQSVKTKAAGAVVLFSGCTRDNSVPEGQYKQPAAGPADRQQLGGNAHTIENGGEAAQQFQGHQPGQQLPPMPWGPPAEQDGMMTGANSSPPAQIPAASLAPVQEVLRASSPQDNSATESAPTNSKDKNYSQSLPVASLTYTSYVPLAMKTLQSITEQIYTNYKLQGIAIAHRLGTVPVGEESVVICVSAGHRQEAWRVGEWALEEVKKRVEIWKWEVFKGAQDGFEAEAVWRSNVTDNRIRAGNAASSAPASQQNVMPVVGQNTDAQI